MKAARKQKRVAEGVEKKGHLEKLGRCMLILLPAPLELRRILTSGYCMNLNMKHLGCAML